MSKFEQTAMEGFSIQAEIEQMQDPIDIAQHIVHLGEKVSQIETQMNIASKVLEDKYGLTVEQILFNKVSLGAGGETQNGPIT